MSSYAYSPQASDHTPKIHPGHGVGIGCASPGKPACLAPACRLNQTKGGSAHFLTDKGHG